MYVQLYQQSYVTYRPLTFAGIKLHLQATALTSPTRPPGVRHGVCLPMANTPAANRTCMQLLLISLSSDPPRGQRPMYLLQLSERVEWPMRAHETSRSSTGELTECQQKFGLLQACFCRS